MILDLGVVVGRWEQWRLVEDGVESSEWFCCLLRTEPFLDLKSNAWLRDRVTFIGLSIVLVFKRFLPLFLYAVLSLFVSVAVFLSAPAHLESISSMKRLC